MERLEGANCATTDPEVFFPEPGQGNLTKLAKKICADCVVLEPCLAETLANPPAFGIQAGLTAADRAKIKNGRA